MNRKRDGGDERDRRKERATGRGDKVKRRDIEIRESDFRKESE